MNTKELRQHRENLMKLLFQYDFYGNDTYEKETELTEVLLTDYRDIIENLAKIDQVIEDALFDYRLARLNGVDRAIIRLATFEMLKGEVPANIIINEAIELTKEFSDLDDEKQHKFSNKVLDIIYQTIK